MAALAILATLAVASTASASPTEDLPLEGEVALESVLGPRQTLPVTCRLPAGALRSCRVELHGIDDRMWRDFDRLVREGRGGYFSHNRYAYGRTVLADDSASEQVEVRATLSRVARIEMRESLEGLPAIVVLSGRTQDGESVRGVTRTRLLSRDLGGPLELAFAPSSAQLDPQARRYLRRVARLLRRIRGASSLRCEGHASGAREDGATAAAARRVSLRRARGVCRTLRRFGVDLPQQSVGLGRADRLHHDRTVAGRASNRDVVLRIRRG